MNAGQRTTVAASALVAALAAGCSPVASDLIEPWHGYWRNKKTDQIEWASTAIGMTHRDCVRKVRGALSTSSDHAEPVGCVLRGSNYWTVWLTNSLFGGEHFICIERSSTPDGEARYDAILGKDQKGSTSSCLDPSVVLMQDIGLAR